MITRHHCAALLACAAFLTLSPAGHVFAQTPEELAVLKKKAEETAPAGEATYLKTITATGTKTGRDPYSTPAATSTITADEVEQFGNKNIDDALRASPGTFTRDNPQNPGLAVNIRGLGLCLYRSGFYQRHRHFAWCSIRGRRGRGSGGRCQSAHL
jgi:hemoglobin/transferrin/lactoferrin receptor protein